MQWVGEGLATRKRGGGCTTTANPAPTTKGKAKAPASKPAGKRREPTWESNDSSDAAILPAKKRANPPQHHQGRQPLG